MSMGDYTPRGDAALRGFARQIARLKRDLRILETAAQGSYRSVEEGSVDFYDEDGVLRERVGRQKDGSYGRVALEGPVPPTPSEPDVVVIDNGVVAITWDGRCEEKWPFAEFRNVRVHLGDTATFTPTKGNQVGTIHAHRGGTIVAVTESDDDNPVYVRLVAVSTAGHTSDPSPAVLVDELDEDDLEEETEELEWEDGDGHTLTADDIAAGTVTFGLSHDPEVESLLAWWHPGGLTYAGVPQTRGENFTVDFEAATVTWPLSGSEQVGDRMRVYYPYRVGRIPTVPFGSTGWKYLQIATSDATDRSGTGFDDSSWATGEAPFADSTAAHGGDFSADWLLPVAHWDLQTSLWLRRSLIATPGSPVTITVRIDTYASVYWNGTLVGTGGTDTSGSGVYDFTVPGAEVLADNVLAVRASDDSAGGLGDRAYIDVEVVGAS